MKTEEFYFELPERLIAQSPIKNRALSRLLLMDKKSGNLRHGAFRDILDIISPGDCLVINDTKVIPARLFGTKATGGKVEVLLLTRKSKDCWEVLVKPGKKAKPGDVILFGEGLLQAEIKEIIDGGNRIVKFSYEGIFEEILDRLGEMPLPPYITERLSDSNRYQTVYATHEGSVAAPTAGLHFTEELLNELQSKGVNIARVTLHVGLGTFRPVKAENILEHSMHSEYYNIEESQANIINSVKKAGGKIISVGTTSLRTLESCTDKHGILQHGSGWTKIFIYPGYQFKMVDELITNFHLPESTLIMLVAALSNKENILKAYAEAIEKEYRFFSFGDAMFIGDITISNEK